MTEMIEQVARGIENAMLRPGLPANVSIIGDAQAVYAILARAAIEAMREPTGEMIGSCGNLPGSQQEYWRRSIEAALGEWP